MEKKYKIGYTTGVYDMFHIGHLNILRRAKELCEILIVGVTTDELCYERKHKYPIIKEEERMAIVGAMRYVDKVVLQTDMEKIRPVKELGADVVFVGSDWKGTEAWNKYEKEFAEVGCTVVYLDHTDGISSSLLRDKITPPHYTNKVIGYTQGVYDLFHIGHLNLIREAKKRCDILYVGINSDALVETYKNKRPVKSAEERASIVNAIQEVDSCVIVDTLDKETIFKDIHFSRIFIGSDWKGNERWTRTEEILKPLGAEVVYLPHTDGICTTMLRKQISI